MFYIFFFFIYKKIFFRRNENKTFIVLSNKSSDGIGIGDDSTWVHITDPVEIFFVKSYVVSPIDKIYPVPKVGIKKMDPSFYNWVSHKFQKKVEARRFMEQRTIRLELDTHSVQEFSIDFEGNLMEHRPITQSHFYNFDRQSFSAGTSWLNFSETEYSVGVADRLVEECSFDQVCKRFKSKFTYQYLEGSDAENFDHIFYFSPRQGLTRDYLTRLKRYDSEGFFSDIKIIKYLDKKYNSSNLEACQEFCNARTAYVNNLIVRGGADIKNIPYPHELCLSPSTSSNSEVENLSFVEIFNDTMKSVSKDETDILEKKGGVGEIATSFQDEVEIVKSKTFFSSTKVFLEDFYWSYVHDTLIDFISYFL